MEKTGIKYKEKVIMFTKNAGMALLLTTLFREGTVVICNNEDDFDDKLSVTDTGNSVIVLDDHAYLRGVFHEFVVILDTSPESQNAQYVKAEIIKQYPPIAHQNRTLT